MRAIWLLSGCLLLSACARAEPVPYEGGQRVSFNLLPPIETPAFPKARYVGGFDVSGIGTSRLTGLSDLTLTPGDNGLTIDAISDYGDHLRMAFHLRGGQVPQGKLEVTSLLGDDGKPFGSKTMADAEDMAFDPDTGDYYVSFEGESRVVLYSADKGFEAPGERLPLTGLPTFPANQGLEALTFVREFPGVTSLVMGAESGGFWRCQLEDYKCSQLKGPTTPGLGYALVSLAPLDAAHPDEILALYRSYTPWSGARSVLRRLKLEGQTLSVLETILSIEPPLPHDNYEGVAAIKTEKGYRIYLLSDPIGRGNPTRLLMFDWPP